MGGQGSTIWTLAMFPATPHCLFGQKEGSQGPVPMLGCQPSWLRADLDWKGRGVMWAGGHVIGSLSSTLLPLSLV